MKKKKLILIIALLAVLVVIIKMPIKAGISYAPGWGWAAPDGLPACICDLWPAECYCVRIN